MIARRLQFLATKFLAAGCEDSPRTRVSKAVPRKSR